MESIYEDPDSLMGAVADGGQSPDQMEVKVKPVPLPRIKSQMIHQFNSNINTADSLDKTHSTINASSSQSRRPRPVLPPPRPPMNKYVDSAALFKGNSDYSKSITETTERCRDLSLKKKPPPPPPPPPPKPSPTSPLLYADRGPVAKSLTSEANLQTRRSPPSFSPPPPPSGSNDYSLGKFPFYLDIIPNEPDVMDISALLTWLKRVCRQPGVMTPSLFGLDIEEEIKSFNNRAMNVRMAQRLYNLLMMKRRDSLQNSIKEFQSICEKLDKAKKTNKNMGIAGGTTGAVGGVAAVVGIALAPITMGTSLIATAVGAGMVASAGGLGIRAAKANKKTVNRTTVEKTVNDYKSDVADIEHCLQFILLGMNELRRHNTVKLQSAGAHPDALRMADMSHAVFRNMNNSGGMSLIHPGGVTSGSLLEAFAAEIDEYFTEKNNQKLKKSNKSKFAGRVSSLAKALQEELNFLIQMWEMLC